MYTLLSLFRHSTIGGILATLLIGVSPTFVIGEACGAIVCYNSFIYINCLGILVASGACGFVILKGLLIERILSRSMANSLALFVACVELYSSSLACFMPMAGTAIFVDTFAMWSLVVDVGAEGAWEIFGASPSDWVLYPI